MHEQIFPGDKIHFHIMMMEVMFTIIIIMMMLMTRNTSRLDDKVRQCCQKQIWGHHFCWDAVALLLMFFLFCWPCILSHICCMSIIGFLSEDVLYLLGFCQLFLICCCWTPALFLWNIILCYLPSFSHKGEIRSADCMWICFVLD